MRQYPQQQQPFCHCRRRTAQPTHCLADGMHHHERAAAASVPQSVGRSCRCCYVYVLVTRTRYYSRNDCISSFLSIWPLRCSCPKIVQLRSGVAHACGVSGWIYDEGEGSVCLSVAAIMGRYLFGEYKGGDPPERGEVHFPSHRRGRLMQRVTFALQ